MAERIASSNNSQEEYIIYMGSINPSRSNYSPNSYHMKILQEVIGESLIEDRLVRSYEKSFNGFAARLTESECERISEMKEVVSVFPNKKLQLQTMTSSKIQEN